MSFGNFRYKRIKRWELYCISNVYIPQEVFIGSALNYVSHKDVSPPPVSSPKITISYIVQIFMGIFDFITHCLLPILLINV